MEKEKRRERQGRKCLQISVIAALAVLLLTSCGGRDESADNSWVWVPEFTSLEMEEDSYYNIAFLGNDLYYISYQLQDEGFRYRLSGYSLTDGRLEDVPLDWQDGQNRFVTSLFAMDGDGGIYIIAYVTGDDGSEMHLCKFDAEGTPAYDVELSGEVDSADFLAVDGQGRAYISGSVSGKPCVLLYTAEGDYKGTAMIDAHGGGVSAMGCGQDGIIYVGCHGNSGDGERYFLMAIDFDNAKAGSSYSDYPKGDNSVLVPGMEHDFLSYDRTSVYAYDMTTQTGETLFDWLDYDINGSYVTAVNVLEDGRILAVIRDFSSGSCELALLTKVDSTQAMQKETIVLGTLSSNSTLRNAVMQFNRSSDKYHVKIREYLDTQTYDWSDALSRMNYDILSDNCPDILNLADLDLKALVSKGLFVDLNEYLENSSQLERSDFLENLLDVYTVDNRLVTIPSYFSIKTVMGWSTEVGEEMGWTLDELMAYADVHPEAELFDHISRSEMMQYLMSYNEDAFIDWSAGECYFDSDAFLQLLEFVGRFPEKAEGNPEQSSTPVRIQKGEVLLLEVDLVDFDSIQLPLEIYGNKGTCIGFPTADGSAGCMLVPYGAYAITVKSDVKKGAWAFLESFLVSERNSSSFFPALKTQLTQKAADAVKVEYLTDEAGGVCLDETGEPIIKNTGMVVSYGDWEYAYHIATQEEVDLVLELISAAKPVSYSDGNEVINIINEEAEGYYQGQKTAEEVAKIIQSRVQIYVSED